MDINSSKKRFRLPVIAFNRTRWYYGIPLFLILITNVIADTTGNLIINGTFENGNSNGWTTNGDVQVINDCCGSQYDVEFGDSGSIEQDFNLTSDSISQAMLNNGITLNSSVLVQNGEGGEGGWASNKGGADSFTIRLQIKDEDQNILSTTTQTRTTTTDINGQVFTDSVSYMSAGSNIGNIHISGTDANAPATLGGANIDNVQVTMEYDPVVLSVEQTQMITEIFEEIEEISFEEVFVEEYIVEEPMIIESPVEIVEMIPIIEEEETFIEETVILTESIVEEVPIVEEIETNESEVVVEEIAEEIIEEPTEVANETEASSPDVSISVEEISIKVADKIKTVEGQLKATQIIVAKVMQKNNNTLNTYSNVNSDIFVQPNLVDANIDSYLSNTYVDIRNIYSNRTYEDRNGY